MKLDSLYLVGLSAVFAIAVIIGFSFSFIGGVISSLDSAGGAVSRESQIACVAPCRFQSSVRVAGSNEFRFTQCPSGENSFSLGPGALCCCPGRARPLLPGQQSPVSQFQQRVALEAVRNGCGGTCRTADVGGHIIASLRTSVLPANAIHEALVTTCIRSYRGRIQFSSAGIYSDTKLCCCE